MIRNNRQNKEQLLKELELLRKRVAELEAADAKRKKAEEALLESERFLSDVFDSIQDGISVLDRELKVHSVNRVMNLWYKDNLPLEGKKCYEVYQHRDKPCEHCPTIRSLNSGKTEREVVPGLPGGLVEWIELYSFPIRDRETGEVTGAVEFVRDITERKQAELELKKTHDQLEKRVKERTAELLTANENLKRQISARKRVEGESLRLEESLRQAQKMESIGTLAGGIAHDFNNILGAIIGYSELVKDDVPEHSIARQNIEQVLIASARARELIKQILAFSRKADKKRRPVLLSQVVNEAILLLRSTLPATIEIRSSVKEISTPIMANNTELHQVVMNLCTNSAHAMNERGGVLEILLEEADLDAGHFPGTSLRPGKYQQLTVSDTGCGIEPGVINRIFEPYFTTKKHREGTGMGLAVVHGIVSGLGGDISVYSEPGKGTVVHVFLPVAEERSQSDVRRVETEKGGYERILYVDDEKTLVDIGAQLLMKLGYEVDAWADSIEALETFRENPDIFDLVITDQTMPNMTGLELSRELKRIRPDIPVILCTGFSERINEENYKSLGIDAFFTKPIIKKKIAHIIRKVLDNSEICKKSKKT